jgi:regulator of extracellular matrix RemA (YlzA/DUF370 family)
MSFRILSAATAGIVLLTTVSQVAAGGKPVECYQQYHHPPVYDTVYEQVLIRAASHRVEVIPAIYGTRKRHVLITPERVGYRTVPAVHDTVYRTVKVSDGGYSWEWRIINGKKVLCKIKHKAQHQRVAETVVVRAAYKERYVIPAEYGYETERVIVQAEQRRVIDIPAAYGTRARQVLVSEGSSGWQRVKISRYCKG